ncbi:MAG: ATP phosphoribosyltransferase regulatory subunit [Ruminococcus sp.]
MLNENVIKNDERAIFELRSLYRNFGYTQYKMSRFEEYDLYVRNKDFLISDEVITFTDQNGRLLALKPDVTLSIIKNSPDKENHVQKVYYNENVYRVKKGTHNFKEIMQAGLECIGDLKEYDIAEVVLLAAKSLSLISDSFVLNISHMGLVTAVLEDAGLSDSSKKEALSFIRQKNAHELSALCKSEEISEEKTRKLLALASVSGRPSEVRKVISALLTSEKEREAFREFIALCEIIEQSDCSSAVKVDFSVGNHMKYYNGVVLEGYIEGIPTSVLSGGQYDKLMKKMGRKSGAIGFAIYLDLLEELDLDAKSYDIETVLVYDETADTISVTELSAKLSKEGGVLVCTTVPEDIKYKRLIKLTEGGAVTLEENG